jgi:hypothetical protein
VLIGSGIVAVCLPLASCSEPPTTFDVDGKLSPTADEVHDNGNCVFAGTTYHNDDEVVLRGADNILLAFSHLKLGTGYRPSSAGQPRCDMTFQLRDIRPGDVGYQLTVGSSRRIVMSEDQLRATDFQVTPRGRAKPDAPDFEVGAPSSSPQPKP